MRVVAAPITTGCSPTLRLTDPDPHLLEQGIERCPLTGLELRQSPHTGTRRRIIVTVQVKRCRGRVHRDDRAARERQETVSPSRNVISPMRLPLLLIRRSGLESRGRPGSPGRALTGRSARRPGGLPKSTPVVRQERSMASRRWTAGVPGACCDRRLRVPCLPLADRDDVTEYTAAHELRPGPGPMMVTCPVGLAGAHHALVTPPILASGSAATKPSFGVHPGGHDPVPSARRT